MKLKSAIGTLLGLSLGVTLVTAVVLGPPVENKSPNVITTAGDVTTTLGGTTFINHGLQGVGRISASDLDRFGESFGSASSMQVTEWRRHHDGSYSGTLNILPDRGYNTGDFYADYAARINQVDFHFTPYTGTANIGGTTDLEKLQAQNQIAFTTPIVDGVKFTYDDPYTHTTSFTTGLDPGASSAVLFGKTMPYVTTFTGPTLPSITTKPYPTSTVNKLPLDSEALILKEDGSGYVGDEYGANIYYFNEHKRIVGAIVPPAAFQPHSPAGTLNFSSAATPVNGRRNNQGFEGVSLSPSGTRLFALLQSAAVQDSDASNNEKAKTTRLLVYDVSGSPTPSAPIAEYALVLPTYKANGNGGNVNKTCAQSEVIALDNTRFLVLSRDGNGLGNFSNPPPHNPSVFKSILLVDTTVGAPTNFVGDAARNAENGRITTSSGVLDPLITPLTWVEAVNMLNSTQLSKFNIRLDAGGLSQVSKLTLGEKWEGMALVPAHDPANPNDYFLFIGNDNDFLTSNGRMRGPDGTIIVYDGFNGYPAERVPAALDSAYHENDTVILAYRLTIVSADPDGQMFGAGNIGNQYFSFRTRQTHNQDYGRLEYWIRDPRRGHNDDDDRCRGDEDKDYGRDHGWTLGHFEASSIDSVVFSDDPAFQPGHGSQPTVDTARFSGTGRWNGLAGYTFQATATDQGEPGRHRDTFSLVIKDALGVVVASVSGPIDDGNIQSGRLGPDHDRDRDRDRDYQR